MMNKTTTLTLGLAMAITGGASAATLTWTSSPFVNEGESKSIMGTGQFDTSGTLLLADNTGGIAGVYDGITYTAGAIGFDSSHDDLFHDANANFISDSASFDFGEGTGTVTLGTGGVGPALEIGTEYRVQLFIMDGRREDSTIPGRSVEVDGVNQGVYANGEGISWGDGLLVTGTFIADGTSQSFTVETFAGATSKGGLLNALLLHEVPEPSSLALLGLGGLLIGARRRRG